MEKKITYTKEAIEYIAKQAQGGMRDAITMLDKCLSYSNDLSIENITKALGIADYTTLVDFVEDYIDRDTNGCLLILDRVYKNGFDLKQFMRSVTDFVLDMYKYCLGADFMYLNCPNTIEIKSFFYKIDKQDEYIVDTPLLKSLIKLNQEIKWDTNPKARIEAWIITGE